MKKFRVSIWLCFLCNVLFAQNTQFSQYYSAALFLNPGFAGVYNHPSVHLNHKRQVQNVDIVNELTQISLIYPIRPKNSTIERPIAGFGIMAFEERAGIDGIFQTSGAFFTYAHNFKFGILSSDILSVGVQVGYENQALSLSSLAWGSQYNPFFGFDETLPAPVTEFDDQTGALVVNGGIMYYYNPGRNYLLYRYSAFSGFSATNLNGPNKSFSTISDSPEPMLLKYNGGVEIKLKKLYVTPSLLFLYLRGNYQFNAGLNFAYSPRSDRYRSVGSSKLLFGAWYRLRDSFILMGGFQYQSLAVRASFDMNSNLFAQERFVDIAQNSFEISIQYHLVRGRGGYRRVSNPLF